ncbi:MAG: T9SS type B sorting domain-containing protein [Bacteroidia bacterium]
MKITNLTMRLLRLRLAITMLLLILSPLLWRGAGGEVFAQTTYIPQPNPFIKHVNAKAKKVDTSKLRTTNPQSVMTATCPTSPVTLAGQDSLGATVTNGQTLSCGAPPFWVYVPTVAGDISSPCIETNYTNFDFTLQLFGTENFYQGGTYQACVGPGAGCAFPIGGGTAIPGAPWAVSLSLLDPNQPHEFVFCRSGSIATTTITLIDCWNGDTIASTPTNPVLFSNANPPNTSTCFTLTVPAGTDIGTAFYSISPPSAGLALTNLHDGEAYINTHIIGPGTYTVNYTFTPPAADGCPAVTGNFTFTIAPITVAVNSPTVCGTGSNATLTATGSGGTPPYTYSWTPSTGLSATTGSMVTVTNPTVTTIYTVTAMDGVCSATATSTVTVTTFTVNKATLCSGNPVQLIASNNSLTYTWTPATTTTVSATTDTALVNPPSTTIYTITGSNTVCPSIIVTDSVIVKLSPTITVLSPTVCSGTTATITASGASSYTWTPLTNLTASITNDTVYISNPTTNASYTVVGTATNSCRDSAVSNVVISTHLGILSGTPINTCYGNQIWLSAIGASTYTWSTHDTTHLNFGGDSTWQVSSSIANVGSYTIAIYGESHSGTYCNGWDTVHLTVNPTPIVSVVGSNTSICTGSSATLTATSSGPAIANYNWVSSSGLNINTGTTNTLTVSPTISTTYTVTGATAAGCSSWAAFTISVTPVPSFTVNSPAICIGGSDSLKVVPTTSVSGAGTYTWSASPPTLITNTVTFGATALASPTVTSSYTVTGINTAIGISCSNTATSTVTVNPLPTLTVSINPISDSICSGNTATLTANGATSYTWNTGATTAMITPSPTLNTTYTVTGTSSFGCTNTTTATISVSQRPIFTYVGIPSFSMCAGGTDTIEVVPTNTAIPASYSWTAPANGGLTIITGTMVTVTPTGTGGGGNYTYTVTATNGACTVTRHPQIRVHNPPVLIPTPDTTVCSGNTVILNANPQGPTGAGATYTWSPIGIDTVSVAIHPTASAIYTVQATSNRGCISSPYTVTVTVNPVPIVVPSVNNPLCKGETINLTDSSISGSPTYTWSCSSNGYNSNSANPTIPNSTTANNGTYTLTITSGGCTASNTIAVTVNNPPIISISPSTASVCPNAPYTFTASGAATYTWTPTATLSDPNSDVPIASPTTTTVYSVTGTDGNGCSNIVPTTLTVIVDPIAASFIPSPDGGYAPLPVMFANNSISGTTSNTYTWNYGNGSSLITNSDSSTHTLYPKSGTYTVTLTAQNSIGCISTDTLIIIVIDSYTITIPNVFTPNEDLINDNWVVKSEGVSAMNILIYDRWGLKMFESTTINAPWNGKNIAGNAVPDDTYFYLINTTDEKKANHQYKGFITLLR